MIRRSIGRCAWTQEPWLGRWKGLRWNFPRKTTERPIIYLPMPDGSMARFRFEESPIMAAGPRSVGIRKSRPTAGRGWMIRRLRCASIGRPLGLHAIILSGEGAAFIEPVSSSDPTTYVSYFNRDVSIDRVSFSCLLSEAEIAEAAQRGVGSNQGIGSLRFCHGIDPAHLPAGRRRDRRVHPAIRRRGRQHHAGANHHAD